ncbi:MAG: chemotaxis response regulator protein-glutamate methylesterase [Chromatiales bacterium 21-64-14]|nr:MAG: chemotaxis response regulator protein-glutamate methylesterase [Chromatiales bacterium 21-64-14]HQU15065.1 chemotaxis response regulator protein-glutamate methylesterase [Gammaproteobacteria bacterium]
MSDTGIKADNPHSTVAGSVPRARAPVRALVVDDSGFFRRRVCEILSGDPNIQVVGTAHNGQDAIQKVTELRPDVITMDIEMPVMDGISAVRRIMSSQPTPILMFSSLTYEGAKATLDALDAGALDFLPKRLEDIARNREDANRMLRARVIALGRNPMRARAVTPPPAPVPAPLARVVAPVPAPARRTGVYQVLVIGTSTGGPAALQRLLPTLPGDCPIPLFLVQHMPASFTGPFAERLDQLCKIHVKEAADGDPVEGGTAYLAPGGRQMLVERHDTGLRVRVVESRPDVMYRPSVDVSFASLARAYPGRVLAIILTGMGSDGREGARLLKETGSTVWAQDEASCVVYGMPQAVASAGLADRILSLDELGAGLARQF